MRRMELAYLCTPRTRYQIAMSALAPRKPGHCLCARRRALVFTCGIFVTVAMCAIFKQTQVHNTADKVNGNRTRNAPTLREKVVEPETRLPNGKWQKWQSNNTFSSSLLSFVALDNMCQQRLKHVSSSWFLHNLKMGLRLLHFQAGNILPAAGSFLGMQRHGLLSSPWDDDLDFSIHPHVFQSLRIRARQSKARQTVFMEDKARGIFHISNSARARRLAKLLFAVSTGVEAVATFAVTDQAEPQRRWHCISLVFLKWGFLHVKVHTNRVTDFSKQELCVGPGYKLFDVFPFGHKNTPSRAVAGDAGATFERLVASATLLKVEGIPLLVVPRAEARPILARHYGQAWQDEIMFCPHSRFTNFQACRASGAERIKLRSIESAMWQVSSCNALLRSGHLTRSKISDKTHHIPTQRILSVKPDRRSPQPPIRISLRKPRNADDSR